MNHVITCDQLKKGHHIYRHLSTGICDIDAFFFQHHGIVSHVPSINANPLNILVLEMTKNADFAGIHEVTLELFLEGRKLRIVKYNVSYWYQKTHVSGTCHTEQKSDPMIILKRCHQIQRIFADINNTYSLFGMNCEHFALFCATGMVHSGIKSTQILSLLRKADDAAHCAHKVGGSGVAHAAHIHSIHSTALAHNAMSQTANSMTHASTNVAAKASGVITSNASTVSTTTSVVADPNTAMCVVQHSRSIFQPISGGTVCIFVGVAAGLEAMVSAYEIWKYKNDVTYFKEDLKRDLIEGWTNTTVIIGVGIIGMAMGFGWWIIIPMFGVSALLHWLFDKYHTDKPYKEKCYIERGLSLDSSIKEKKNEVKRIKQEIKKEKLHPNHWKRDIDQKILGDMPDDVSGIQKIIAFWKKWKVKGEKQKRLEKFLWLMSVKELLEDDINNCLNKYIDEIVDEVMNGYQLATTLEQDKTIKSTKDSTEKRLIIKKCKCI